MGNYGGSMRLVIVGNAGQPSSSFSEEKTPSKDIAQFIDESDIVIRFGRVKNQQEGWTGARTDILYMRGNGKPAFKYSETPINFERVDRPKQIVSVVDMHGYKRRRPDKREKNDYTDKIVALNRFDPAVVSRLDQKILVEVRGLLQRAGSELMPSLGLASFVHVLGNPELESHEKFVVGFTFGGWEGHDWQQEQRLAEAWFASGALKPLA
jgi:hypothetical protein